MKRDWKPIVLIGSERWRSNPLDPDEPLDAKSIAYYRGEPEIYDVMTYVPQPSSRDEEVRERITAAVESGDVLAKAVEAYKENWADKEWRWDVPGNLCEVRDVFLGAALDALAAQPETTSGGER